VGWLISPCVFIWRIKFRSISELLRAVLLDQCGFTAWSIRQNYLCTCVRVCVLALMSCWGMFWGGNDFLVRWLTRHCSWTVRVFRISWLRISARTPTVMVEIFWFSSLPRSECGIVHKIMLTRRPLSYFSNYCLRNILPFCTVFEILAASLNKPYIGKGVQLEF